MLLLVVTGITTYQEVRFMKVAHLLIATSCLATSAGAIASAAVVETDTSSTAETTYDSTILNNDLINQGQSTLQSVTGNGVGPNVGTPLTGLDDGAASHGSVGSGANDTYYNGRAPYSNPGETVNSLANSPPPQVTFTLNTGVGGSSNGYTITSINSIYGWQDWNSFSDQQYNVAYSTVSNPGTFISLKDVSYDPFAPGNPNDTSGVGVSSSDVLLGVTGVTNVGALRFTFTGLTVNSVEQAGQAIREIDVSGAATPVPEPATFSALALGAAGLLIKRRRLVLTK